jgi:glutamate-1-semialdehyde 2,1-aminomutase
MSGMQTEVHSLIVDEYLQRTQGSRALAEKARAIFPDGVSTDTRLFEPYGIYVKQAEGVKKWDVDGNEYLDFFGGHGALMLGHSHPRVVKAVSAALAKGIQFAANHPLEVSWAQEIQKHFQSAERVRFAGSGTEATLLAIRIARAFSQRKKILRVISHYHGWHDFAVSGYASQFDGSPAPGVLPEIAANTLLVKPGDTLTLRSLMRQYSHELAAVILEPLGSHFGHIPTADEFIIEALQEARRNDVLVIFDEVVSGFRVGVGGMQGLLGLIPDLTCLAKIAAGGMPGGVVTGSAKVMSVLSKTDERGQTNPQKVLHQGTFTGNPVTASAALTTIREIVEKDLCAHASRLGAIARESLSQLFRQRKLGWIAFGRFSAFHILPRPGTSPPDPATLAWDDYRERPNALLQKLRMALNLEGVDIGTRGTAFLSGVHNEADVNTLLLAFDRALDRLTRDRLIS